jgi:hypothetical protein
VWKERKSDGRQRKGRMKKQNMKSKTGSKVMVERDKRGS